MFQQLVEVKVRCTYIFHFLGRVEFYLAVCREKPRARNGIETPDDPRIVGGHSSRARDVQVTKRVERGKGGGQRTSPVLRGPGLPPTAWPLTAFLPLPRPGVLLCLQVKTAQITAVDRLGMYVLVTLPNGDSGKLRLPFPRPAESRKDVKTLIVEMTQAAKAAEEGE